MTTETAEARNARLNAEAANAAHTEGRHTANASHADRTAWAAMGCTRCAVVADKPLPVPIRLGLPSWGGSRQVRTMGQNYGFSMYSREGNEALAALVRTVIEGTAYVPFTRDEAIQFLQRGLRHLARVHAEVRDTEPEVRIVEVVNEWFDRFGLLGITRDDLS